MEDTSERRICKTKTALCNALSQLIKQKDFHNICVKNLCDTADIHRTTFYYHYSDINDFYHDMENTFLAEISAIVNLDKDYSYEETLEKLVEYVYTHGDLCTIAFCRNNVLGTYKKLSDMMKASYMKIWRHEANEELFSQECLFLMDYHIQGGLAVIESWLNTDLVCPKNTIISLLREVGTELDHIMASYLTKYE